MKVQSRDDQDFIQNTESTNRESNPESEFAQMELKELLKKALTELPEEQLMVVIMKEYEGLKIREIAEAMDISENTVKSRLYI
jgi:RNA polymerase sigma-70 factor (ECF subfamily)